MWNALRNVEHVIVSVTHLEKKILKLCVIKFNSGSFCIVSLIFSHMNSYMTILKVTLYFNECGSRLELVADRFAC